MLSYVLNAEVFNNLIKVPCHLYATRGYKNLVYFDLSLPLIYNQTISQPFIVALITHIVKLGKMILPCAEFFLSEINCLTKNKNEALDAKFIPGVRFLPITGGIPK